MLTIRSTFLYLDRTYVISTSGTRSLFEMGLQLYGQHLQQHPEVRPNLLHVFLPQNLLVMVAPDGKGPAHDTPSRQNKRIYS